MSRLYIGRVEPYGSQEHLTQSDILYIESLSSAKRQAEVASWRELLRRTLSTSDDILYHESGAPYLQDSNLHFSVSHSSSYVAIIMSHAACAVDIESLSRDFERVASRYTTIPELELNSGTMPLLPLLWSAKETLFKLSPLDGLDLRSDITVTSIDGDQIKGRVKGCDGVVEMECQLYDGHIVIHTK